MEVTCCNCNIVFIRNPSQIKRCKNNYCSRKCFNKIHIKRFNVECFTCKKLFKPTQPNRNKNNYCSRKCYFEKNGKKTDNCIVCMKKINRKTCTRLNTCSRCYTKEYYHKDEKLKEKLQTYARNHKRVKRNIPIELPLLLAPAGSGSISAYGYKLITKKDHPNAHKKGTIFEHQFVMSEHLGRPLRKGETIHHKNGIKTDNRIENLELWNKGQPPGQRVIDRINYYKEFLESYGAKVDMSNIENIEFGDDHEKE